MANTHDYSIANDTGSAVRTDLNTLFTEVEATNAGATAPANLATGKLWYDTANNLLKQYNGSAWVVVQSGATPDIGTPSAGVVTNLSGVLPVGVTGGSGLDAVSPANLASGVLPVGVTGGSGLDAVSPANLASGVLPVGVTGGSGLDAVSPANLASGVLPVGVTGGSGLTALGTVTSGVLEDAVTYRNIDQDLATTDAPTFAGATINGAVSTRSGGASIIEKCYHQAGSNNTAAVITISTPSSGYLSATIEANLAGFQGGGHYRGHIYECREYC